MIEEYAKLYDYIIIIALRKIWADLERGYFIQKYFAGRNICKFFNKTQVGTKQQQNHAGSIF